MAFEYAVGNPGIKHLDESKLVNAFETSILENDSLESALQKALNSVLESMGTFPGNLGEKLDKIKSELNKYDLFSGEKRLRELAIEEERKTLEIIPKAKKKNEEKFAQKIDEMFKPEETAQPSEQQQESPQTGKDSLIHTPLIREMLKQLEHYEPAIKNEGVENPSPRVEIPNYKTTGIDSKEMREMAKQVGQFLKMQASFPSEMQIVEKLNQLNASPQKISKTLDHLKDYNFISQFAKNAFSRLKMLKRDQVSRDALEANENVQEHQSGALPQGKERAEKMAALSTIAATKENRPLIPIQQRSLERMLSQQERDELGSWQQSLAGQSNRTELSKKVATVLQERGMVKFSNGKYTLTPKAMRQVARKCLSEIFSDLKKGLIGRHETEKVSYNGLEMRDSVKQYEFGDALHLDVTETLRNALRKSTQVPIRLDYTDFVVRETGNVTNSATVIAIDVSGSMNGLPLLAAKKITLALECLIEERFKGDCLDVIAFSDNAQIVPRYAMARMGNESTGFTNFQEALLLSEKLLSRKKALNKQIILVSDMEPTMLSYSPPENFIQRMNTEIDKQKKLMNQEQKKAITDYYKQRELIMQLMGMSSLDLFERKVDAPLAAALYEASRLSKQKIRVNFYMMGNHPPLESLIPFYSRFTTGKIFTPKAESLGKAVMYDFLKGSRKQIG